MKLRCQSKGTNCPPFKHNGIFYPDNETVKRLLPDLNRCADCIAYVTPTLLSFRDDFLQIASITLLEKAPALIRHTKAARVSEHSSVRVSV